ncbi:MAG: division/cell wall cluster transcriptional repressor MraZ [Oscillospiraceae bacterium]|nr:division/cell wall cluster transcriptional repressor MraZ [Oscillospiraceae bacterium]
MAANSLMGTYEHTMDAKGRMAFPTKLRDRLGVSFIVTIGLDGCLYVYSNEEWDIFTEKLQTLTGAKAKAAKLIIVNACTVEPDKQGRILIPQNLRDYAHLDHDVTVLGVINRAEIWDSARFKEFSSEITNEMLSDALSELAF